MFSIEIKAPSSRIRIFLNPQLFLSEFKKFPHPHVAYSNRIRLSTYIPWYLDSVSSTQGSSAIKCVQSMRHKARAIVAANMLCCCCCAALLVYCSVRVWTRICYPDSPVHMLSDSLEIYFFPHWRVDLKKSEFALTGPKTKEKTE